MTTNSDKNTENKRISVTESVSKSHNDKGNGIYLEDNRPSAVLQQKMQAAITGNKKNTQLKSNNTGLPEQLKAGIENLSGYSMDDVKVNYNSSEPTQLAANAFARGSEIHLSAGQEKHLAHEAWHVVQQKQGRVSPTNLNAGVNINDDRALEKEADVMGSKALQLASKAPAAALQNKQVAPRVTQQYSAELIALAEYLGIEATLSSVAAFLGISTVTLTGSLAALSIIGLTWTGSGAFNWIKRRNNIALPPGHEEDNEEEEDEQQHEEHEEVEPIAPVENIVHDQHQQDVQQEDIVVPHHEPEVAALTLAEQYEQQWQGRYTEALRNVWMIRYHEGLPIANIARTALTDARIAFTQAPLDQAAFNALTQEITAVEGRIAQGADSRHRYYIRITHLVVHSIMQPANHLNVNPNVVPNGLNADGATEKLLAYQLRLHQIEALFNAAVQAGLNADDGIGNMVFKGVAFAVHTNDNNYISAAGQGHEQYPDRPVSPIRFRNMINAMINDDNAAWMGYNPRELAIFLAGVFVEPRRYAPSSVTNLIAAGRAQSLHDAGHNTIFNTLTMTTGGTDPAANPTHGDLAGVAAFNAHVLPTQATGEREYDMIMVPNLPWITDADHLQNEAYTDNHLTRDLRSAQRDAIRNFLYE